MTKLSRPNQPSNHKLNFTQRKPEKCHEDVILGEPPASAIESSQDIDEAVTFSPVSTSYRHMQSFDSIRLAIAVSFAFSALLPAQSPPVAQAKPGTVAQSTSSLPATPPTTPEPPPTPSQLSPNLAQVTYTTGVLSISADNSSLNQILHEISHETGIKISGGVSDERVFGQYGPDAPAQVLAALLDGAGSNMLFVHSDGDTPAQLILTPRQGRPTPPNPNAAALEDRRAPEIPHPAEPVEPTPERTEQRAPPPDPPVTPGASATSDPSQPDSPNGGKTPQQIYDQLQRLRQQQQPPQTPQTPQ
jgi:hypothetical protein